MKKVILVVLIMVFMLALATSAFAAPPEPPAGCWGELTSEAIAGGFPQGEHASNQSNPRAGLANVFGQGDLSATCDGLSP